jgi:class 3 adenylate cyclase
MSLQEILGLQASGVLKGLMLSYWKKMAESSLKLSSEAQESSMPQETSRKAVLFLSADLVGSTEYKVRVADADDRPGWLTSYEKFFREVPLVLMGQIALAFDEEETVPDIRVWKVAGDEILFSSELRGPRECGLLLKAFCGCIKLYNQRLSAERLGLRGCAWGAVFPTRNIELEIPEMAATEGEGCAFQDYLGPDVDTGFRLAGHADPGEVVVSINAAAAAGCVEPAPVTFTLKGQEPLKGLFSQLPYPLLLAALPEDATPTGSGRLTCGDVLDITLGFLQKIGYTTPEDAPFRLF